MTENMKVAIDAINKFMFYCWNYDTISHTWETFCGEEVTQYVPEFLVKVNWTCNFNHMHEKWKEATSKASAYDYIPRFYAEIDSENRRIMLEWIVENYNGERKIYFGD